MDAYEDCDVNFDRGCSNKDYDFPDYYRVKSSFPYPSTNPIPERNMPVLENYTQYSPNQEYLVTTYGPLTNKESVKEIDPTGRNPHEPGAKLDSGKPMPDLILDGMSLAIMEVAKVATMGAKKYSENGWLTVPDGVLRYRRAGDRHRLYRRDEAYDPESELLHLAHEAWNRLAELELTLRDMRNGSDTN